MRLQKVLVCVWFGAFVLAALVHPPLASAQTLPWQGKCIHQFTPTAAEGQSTPEPVAVATITGLECMIANILIVFIIIIGLASLVMFVLAAFRWMLSGGNSKEIQTARGTMTYAIVGIIVALSAYLIVSLVTAFTGVDVRELRVPNSNTPWTE
jgi:hypothetical protein